MTEAVSSYYWERRGNVIYTEGTFEDGEYVKGSANRVIDFAGQIHTDHIDHIVESHNQHIENEVDDAFKLWKTI